MQSELFCEHDWNSWTHHHKDFQRTGKLFWHRKCSECGIKEYRKFYSGIVFHEKPKLES